MVRDALALRVDGEGRELFVEEEAKTENIGGYDLVWKPVNFVRSNAFDFMKERVTSSDKPFAYSHFDNIGCLSTKPGLIKTLTTYYSRTPQFRRAQYSVWHSMAPSFIIPTAEWLESEELMC